jgi:hypothetical protein
VKPVVALLAALLLSFAGCGANGGSAHEVLSETASNLSEIESGTLFMRLVASGTNGLRAESGFELEGPFSLGEGGPLPVAEIEYRKIAGAEQATATFISTGEEVFVRAGGVTFEVPRSMLADEGGVAGSEAVAGLGELRIEDWFIDPDLSEGGEGVDGVRARLDVVAAVNDLLELVRAFGAADLGLLEGRSAEQLERSVRSGRIEVLTGKDDRLLRRLTIDVDLGPQGPRELEQALGELGGARLRFEFGVSDHNEPVEVEAPRTAVPFPG